MLATTAPIASGDSSKKKLNGSVSSKMTQETQPGTSNGRDISTNGEALKKSSSLGGFLKILSPKYHRSRSKSPSVAAATNGERCKNKSWVTVEIKNGHDETDRCLSQQQAGVVRSGTDGQLVTTLGGGAGSGSSTPGSPVSTSSLSNDFVNGGSSSPMSRVRNLFGRNSFKKQHRQKSATLSTSSPRDVSGWSYDVVNSSSSSADRPQQWPPISSGVSDRQLHDPNVECDVPASPKRRHVTLSAKSKFDAFIAQLSHKSFGRADATSTAEKNQDTAGARTALSEENLVSKSLACENVGVCLSPDPSTACSGATKVNTNQNLLSCSTGYYSQDSVFDTSTSSTSSSSHAPGNGLNANSRIPSYVRLSCTLSGYKNYRSVDLRTPSPIRSPPLMPRIQENFAANSQAPAPTVCSTRPPLPVGKSIVERRLEKFQQDEDHRLTTTTTTTNMTTPVIMETMLTDLNGDSTNTPTPIRDIISNFNKLSLNTTPSRPRQKPPPLPPPRTISRTENTETTNEEEPIKNGSLLDEVLSAGDRVINDDSISSNFIINNGHHVTTQCNNNNNNNNVHLEYMANGAISECVSAVVIEPVNSRVDKRVLAVEQQPQQQQQHHHHHHHQLNNQTGNAHAPCTNGSVEKSSSSSSAAVVVEEHEAMNGRQYNAIAVQERDRLEKLLQQAEHDLADDTLPEHAAETLRIAVGKLKLLLRKKFTTFEELIEKNLNPVADDPRPTLDLDLAGYYQLVKIELDDIDHCFDAVERLRLNGWQQCQSDDAVDSKVTSKQPVKKSNVSAKSAQENAAKAKEAARQRLKDAKMAALERKKNDAQATNTAVNGDNSDNVQFIGT